MTAVLIFCHNLSLTSICPPCFFSSRLFFSLIIIVRCSLSTLCSFFSCFVSELWIFGHLFLAVGRGPEQSTSVVLAPSLALLREGGASGYLRRSSWARVIRS